MSGETAAELAQRAAGHARDQALAHVARERSLLLRYALNRPTQATAVDDVTVELAVLWRGHVGRASTNGSDDESLAACARRAELAAQAAAAAGGPGEYPGFPTPQPGRSHQGHDAQTAALDPEPGGAALAAAFAAAEPRGLEAHGVWTAGELETAVANGDGVAVDRVTDAFMKAICIDPRSGRSGYAAQTAVAASGLDPAAVAERAAKIAAGDHPARSGGGEQAARLASGQASGAGVGLDSERAKPAVLAPGEYPVVFEAHALGTLLDLLGMTAFNGLAHAERRGALDGKLGTQVAAPCVNLSDSPRFPGTLSRAIDAEGVPKAPLPLIQDGIAHRVTHDTRSAALAGAQSTGHALSPGGSSWGAVPTNLVLGGGGAVDEAELCAPIERGIYVTRLWYANPVRPKETLVTAVTRDGTFLIEDGRITRPLADLRLTDSVLGLLSRVQALTARQQLANEGEFYDRRFAYGVVCPAVRISSARFTDAAG